MKDPQNGAQKALKLIGYLFLIAVAVIFHRYETNQYPFDGQIVQQKLDAANAALQSAGLAITAKEAELSAKEAELSAKEAELRKAEIAIMLTDTLQKLQVDYAVMQKELAMTKTHSTEVIGLVKAHQAEMTTTLQKVYSADAERDHQVTRDLVGVSKEYANKSGDCCPQDEEPKKPAVTRNFFEFRFEGLQPIPEVVPPLDSLFQDLGLNNRLQEEHPYVTKL